MLSLKERIALLEHDLLATPPGFIMARSLPFAIFRYDPEDEWSMRQEIGKLATRVQNVAGRKVGVVSMADLFWQSVRDSEGTDVLVEFEREMGFDKAEQLVNQYLSDPDFRPLCDLLLERAREAADKDLLFLAHATVFAPSAYRISSLLEQMGGRLPTPAVLFYPGSWNQTLNYMGLRTEDQSLGSYRVKIYGRES